MLILAKIHKTEFIEDMYKNEYLYFSSLKHFKASPSDKSGRLDPKELNVTNKQLKTLTVKVKEKKEIDFHNLLLNFSAQLTESLSEPKINCCSLHWIEIEPNERATTFNDQLLQLGDKAILIFDWIKFFKILDKSLHKMGFKFSRKKVVYYDSKIIDGEISLHHKDIQYNWQNEYRILIAPTDNNPISVPIPGLKKISLVIETKELENLRIEINNN